jgi:ABC-type lipoprotein export system ATPase subunit
MLELDRARKHYSTPAGDVHAVDDVNLKVDSGEVVALFGPSGSGKTTLLMLAGGLLRCDSGEVRFDGRDLGKLTRSELLDHRRTKLGFVFQNYNLIPGFSAQENVALPLLLGGVDHRQAERRAAAGLQAVDLSERRQHQPTKLSGGEQQRVAVARALINQPKLILADEPTGNLDSATGDAILNLLVTHPRQQGAALILVTHDVRVARHADRVLAIRDGKLASFDPEAAMAGR